MVNARQDAPPLAPEPPTEAEVAVDPVAGVAQPAKKPRLASLDAFRGFTIVLMLLVNNIALDKQTPGQLLHADWNAGLTMADMVFPWFLFCVGVSIPFSVASFRKTGRPEWLFDLRIVWRAVALVFLGCLIASVMAKRPVFTLDVLQLIGLAYFVGAFLYDLPLVRRMILASLMLLGYGLAIQYVPFPGAAPGTFRENSNLIQYVNTTFLVPFHLDGLFSTIPTAALVMYGSMIGDMVRKREWEWPAKLGALAACGVGLLLVGAYWNQFLPYNKPVWTPSYILVSGGFGTLIVAALFVVMDLRGFKAWAYPLLVFGSNAIVAYVVPIILKLTVFGTVKIQTGKGDRTLQQAFMDAMVQAFGRYGGGWAYTVAYIAIWWIVLWVLYRRRIFLRV